MIIYRMTDRVTLDIKGLVFKLAPLSFEQKTKIALAANNSEAIKLAIKYSLKDMEGVENIDGSSYALDIINNELTDTCIDELTNLSINSEIQLACMSMINGIKNEILHPLTGKPIEGVKIVNPQLAQTK